MTILLFFVGLYILLKGANYIIDSSLSVAARYSINSVIIGLTLVAFGTSAPELAINISSNLKQLDSVAFSTVIGSSIFNNLLVLGLVLTFSNIKVNKRLLIREMPFGIVSAIMLFVMTNDSIFSGVDFNTLSRADGLIFLLIFSVFVWILATYKEGFFEKHQNAPQMSLPISGLVFVSGVLLVAAGSNILIDSAIEIATAIGVSYKFIGVSMVAFSTSVPELATAYVAIKKKQTELVFGNIVGSNIFNILFILGITTQFGALNFRPEILNTDLIIMILAKTILLLSVIFAQKKHTLSRKTGLSFLTLFAIYIVYITLNASV